MAIRSLIWLAVYTRPDIAYLVGIFSKYYSNSRPIYYSLVVQVFCYLSSIFDFEITFQANFGNKLVGYTNSNYMGLIDGQKSTKGYIFILSGRLLSH